MTLAFILGLSLFAPAAIVLGLGLVSMWRSRQR